jgi:hypothetical protein
MNGKIILMLQEEYLSGRVETQNAGFILFMVCLFILGYLTGKKGDLLVAMKGNLLGKRGQEISYETLSKQVWHVILFSMQTLILISIIIYCRAVNKGIFSKESTPEMFVFIGRMFLLFAAYVFYKFITYALVSYVFFERKAQRQWIETFFSAICLSGIVLFVPALLLFFVEPLATYGLYFTLAYFTVLQMVLLFKEYRFLFERRNRLCYFIFYLCAQEIIPLFFLYKGFLYLF